MSISQRMDGIGEAFAKCSPDGCLVISLNRPREPANFPAR